MYGDNLSGRTPNPKKHETPPQSEVQGGVEFSLEHILGDNHDTLEHPGLKQQELNATSTAAEGWDEESVNGPTMEGYCIECEGECGVPWR